MAHLKAVPTPEEQNRTPEEQYAYYHREIQEIISDLKDYIEEVKVQATPSDIKNLKALHADLADRERRHALNAMYMGDSLIQASEGVAATHDPKMVSSLTAMLRAL